MDAYPTYVGLGAHKAGTTLLASWLEDHPQVSVPRTMKEVDFFTSYYERGLDWYRSLFDPSSQASGEFSVRYLQSESALARIAKDLPWARCIVSLRDPIERIASEHRHAVRFNGYKGNLGAYAAEHPGAVDRGRYATQLANVLERFPREQIEVLVFEEVVTDPLASARQLYEFLGVEPDYVPSTLRTRVNPTGQGRWGGLDRLAHRVQRFAKQRNKQWLSRVGRSTLVRRVRALNARPSDAERAPLQPEAVAVLRDLYAEDIATTSRLAGKDLAVYWLTACQR